MEKIFETCDMHIHTQNSDGKLSNLEIIEECKKRNLKYFSITDHDNVDFYFDKKALQIIKDNKMEIIAGCEFVAKIEDMPIEILGYGIDVKKAKRYLDNFGITQNKLESYRSDMIPKIFEKYGIRLDYDASKIDFSLKNPGVLNKLFDIINNNEQAKQFVLRENPHVLDSVSKLLRQGFNNPNSKICINMDKILPDYNFVIDLIHSFGGFAFLAHPYNYNEQMDLVLDTIRNSNIDGIECYHHTSVDNKNKDYLKRDYLIDFCNKNNLMISGGSDFHKVSDQLNELNVPKIVFDKIQQTLSKTKLRQKNNII